MNIRAKIFGGAVEEPLLQAKAPKGARADVLNSIAVAREESRRSNHRQSDRHRLTLEQAVVQHDGCDHIVELVNLSAGGAMIRGQLELMLWDHVGLILGDHGELDCAVRWLKGDEVGLEFAHETRIDCDPETRDDILRTVIRKSFPDLATDPLGRPVVEQPIEEAVGLEAEEDSRRESRHPLIWSGTVYHDCGAEPARLRNISANGALIQANNLTEGATVYLDLGPAGNLEAVVRWSRGKQAGLAFREPFDIRSLATARPIVAGEDSQSEQPWAPGWNRATVDEMSRSLGG